MKIFFGWTLISLGALNVLLPFIPGGFVMVAAGVALVGRDNPRLRLLTRQLKRFRRRVQRWLESAMSACRLKRR